MTVQKRTKAEMTRQHVLNSALETLRQHGTQGLTLDSVARAAAISKGGLLHHFHSKDALVEALLQQLFGEFEQRIAQYVASEPGRPGRWLRAYVRATFDEDPMPLELANMLLSAVMDQPRLLGMIRDDALRWQQRLLADGVPAPRATVVRQAADAYWTDRLIGVAPTDAATLASIRDELLRLTEVAAE